MNRMYCHLAAIPLRREPSDRSEMTNQLLFGETVEILEENEKWYMIKSDHDGYEGWIDRKQVQPLQLSAHTKTEFIKSLFAVVMKDGASHQVLPAGSIIPTSTNGTFQLGRSMYIINQHVHDTEVNDILHVAFMFIGSPYLWGGRTFMGIDCSGFTQVVMRLCNQSLPRDANQQAEIGNPITFIAESKNGDLAFFDNAEGKITHVGIIFNDDKGAKKIIHASGQVRVDSIDHQGIFNLENGVYSHNLRIIKRIN